MSEEMQQDTAAVVPSNESGDAPVVSTDDQNVSAAAEVVAATAQPKPEIEDRSWQSRYDRLKQEVSDELVGYARTYGGGKNIVGFLKQFEQVLGHPDVGPLAQQLLKTGRVEFPKAQPANEWDEPQAEPEWKPLVSSALQELQAVKQELTEFKTRQGMTAITDHTKKFLSEYPMDDQERALFNDYMGQQWSTLSANPNGSSILSKMDYTTFRTLALPGIEEFRSKIEARRMAKSRGQLAQKATDAPAQAPAASEKRPNGAMPQNAEQLRRQVQQAFAAAFRD